MQTDVQNTIMGYTIAEKLGKSPTELTEKIKKKIYTYIPVPNNHEILWADCTKFNGFPSGIIITDKALIYKASKEIVDEKNKEIKKENKGKDKKDKKSKILPIYKMIPWEYYDPEDFTIQEIVVGDYHSFRILLGDAEFATVDNVNLVSAIQSLHYDCVKDRERVAKIIEDAVGGSAAAINAREALYCARYGWANNDKAFGIWAEDVGAKLDRFNGEKVTVVGRDNAKNGADKIVDGAAVQCKYCRNAKATLDACFAKGEFRYRDLDGAPMKIEVPKDQYDEVIELFKDKITEGKVEGVSDPEQAYNIIRKGKLTQQQAVNLAKAGTIESITYDIFTGAVRCLSAFGISFVVSFAQVYWSTKDAKKAIKCALLTGLEVYGISIVGSVIATQLSRTGIEKLFSPFIKTVLNALPAETVNNMANQTRALLGFKPVSGAAAKSYYTKYLSSQIAMECIMFIVFSSQDIFDIMTRSISGSQFALNMTSRALSMTGGMIAGSKVGKWIGTLVCPGLGTVAGAVAGTATGIGLDAATRGIWHWFKEDDSVIMWRMFNSLLMKNCFDYMLSVSEQEKLMELLEKERGKMKKVLKKLLKANNQEKYVSKYLKPKIKKIIKERNRIRRAEENNYRLESSRLIISGELAYEM